MHGDKAPSGANRSNTPNHPLRRARGQVALALTTPLTGPTPDSPSWVNLSYPILNLTQLAPNRLSRAVGAASQRLTRCASALLAGWRGIASALPAASLHRPVKYYSGRHTAAAGCQYHVRASVTQRLSPFAGCSSSVPASPERQRQALASLLPMWNQAAKMGTSLQRSQDKVPARHFTTPRPVDQWYAGGQMRYTRTRVESTSC